MPQDQRAVASPTKPTHRFAPYSIFVAGSGWLLLVLLSYLAIRAASTPPPPVPASAAATEFSAVRALQVLQTFAQRPHPVGSSEHELVRRTLVQQMDALGLHPVTETRTAIVAEGETVVAAKVSNLVGRMPGVENSRAVVLAAHYDSVDRAPGAGDDGGGVATILETMRALRAGPRLKNDVIVLLTDGEEDGLLGAQAAVVHDPWLRQAGVLFNFEGRGDRGPSSLFETSDGNRSILREFRRHVSSPAGSSLAYSLYKLLPNDTDFTVFRRVGLAGLNFAWDARLEAYHSRLDTVDGLNASSVQQDGANALGLTRAFGSLDLDSFPLHDHEDAIFFNWFGMHMVEYPVAWVVPLAIVASLMFFGVVSFAILRGRCRVAAMLKAAGAAVILLVAVPLIMTGVEQGFVASMRLVPGHELSLGDMPSNALCLLGITLVGAICALVGLQGLLRKVDTISLTAGGLIIVWIVVVVMTRLLPSGSYLLFWPFVCAVIGLGWLVLKPHETNFSILTPAVALLAAVPAILLLSPTMDAFFIGLTLNPIMLMLNGFLLAAGCLVAVPFLRMLAPVGHLRYVSAGLVLAAAVCLIISAALSRPSATHPRQDSLVYIEDADSRKAEWASYDRRVDPWTSEMLTASPHEGTGLAEWRTEAKVLWKEAAPGTGLLRPMLTVLQSTSSPDGRSLHLQLQSPGQSRLIKLTFPATSRIVSAQVDGEPLPEQFSDKTSRLPLRAINLYGFGGDPVDVILRVSSSSCNAVVSSHSTGLLNVSPRPDAYMAGPGSDQTIVLRKVGLC